MREMFMQKCIGPPHSFKLDLYTNLIIIFGSLRRLAKCFQIMHTTNRVEMVVKKYTLFVRDAHCSSGTTVAHKKEGIKIM